LNVVIAKGLGKVLSLVDYTGELECSGMFKV